MLISDLNRVAQQYPGNCASVCRNVRTGSVAILWSGHTHVAQTYALTTWKRRHTWKSSIDTHVFFTYPIKTRQCFLLWLDLWALTAASDSACLVIAMSCEAMYLQIVFENATYSILLNCTVWYIPLFQNRSQKGTMWWRHSRRKRWLLQTTKLVLEIQNVRKHNKNTKYTWLYRYT